MTDRRKTTFPAVRRAIFDIASFITFFLAIGATVGLAAGAAQAIGSAAWPYRLPRLALATVSREVRHGLWWGAVGAAVFLPYVLAAAYFLRSFRRAAGVAAAAAAVWALGAAAWLARHADRFADAVPPVYRKMLGVSSYLSRWVRPAIDNFAATRPGELLDTIWLTFLPAFGLALFGGFALRRRFLRRPSDGPRRPRFGRWRAVAGAALALGVAAAYGPRALPRPTGRPNVLLISIDTLRADGLSCYGNPRPTSPFIDAVARQGVRYENYYSNAPWTLPGHVSMLTGLIPDVHGVVDLNHSIPSQAPLLAELFNNAGYDTMAATSIYLVGPSWGFDRGFDRFVFQPEARAERVADAAIELLRRAREPWFAFVHFFDPHMPYTPSEESRKIMGVEGPPAEQALREMSDLLSGYLDAYLAYDAAKKGIVRALYDAEVRDADRGVGRIWREARRLFPTDNTLIVITSDHGEELNEHGWFGHAATLYAESLRVPLILRGPGVPRGKIRGELASTPALAPQILALAGVPDPLGRDWRKIQAGGGAYARTDVFGPPRYSWRRDGLSFLTSAEFQFDRHAVSHPAALFADPADAADVRPQAPEKAAEMQAEMERYVGEQLKKYGAMKAGAIAADPARWRRLKQLGYVN